MTSTRLFRQLFWVFAWVFCSFTVIPFTRVRASGRRNVPRRGPGLLVGNHVTFFDPATVGWASLRRVHGVGTDTILRVPIFGRIVPWLSVIPFSKGLKDRTAMEEIQRRIDQDAVVLIFPEGDRCWTGSMMPVGHGIGRLALRLGVPVLFCRQTTGHLQWPRWAKWPRLVPIEMEFLPPVTYSTDRSAAEVTADIVDRLRIDPEQHRAPRWSWGMRLAEGLPEFLWACPSCYARDGLVLAPDSNKNAVCCTACNARWTVDLSCRLHPADGSGDFSVDSAHKRIVAHFGALPVADSAHFEADGVALEGQVELVQVTRGVTRSASMGTGTLRLRADGLVFDGPQGATEIPFIDVKVVVIQLGDQLQAITTDAKYGIKPVGQSRFLWKHFLDRHLAAFREAA